MAGLQSMSLFYKPYDLRPDKPNTVSGDIVLTYADVQ